MSLAEVQTGHRAGSSGRGAFPRPALLALEPLEDRTLPAVSVNLASGLLSITGGPDRERIEVALEPARGELLVKDHGRVVGQFASAGVTGISIDVGDGDSIAAVDPDVLQPATLLGGAGRDVLIGGGGPTTLVGGSGDSKLIAGPGPTTLRGGSGHNHLFSGTAPDVLVADSGTNQFFKVKLTDTLLSTFADQVFRSTVPPPDPAPADPSADPDATLTPADVEQLLRRAAAATSSDDGIVVIVDRAGRLLGVRAEQNVSPTIMDNTANLVFAVDGALAEARTAAFFANQGAPLTSRTIQFISQTTITQREVDSYPSITDPNSTIAGPGFVAPIGIHGHFPPNISFTPQVDLFEIEGTNRDTSAGLLPGNGRFNIPLQFITPEGQAALVPPDSYGAISGLEPNARPRGIGTLPGGIPIYKTDPDTNTPILVGGIGVFFPGRTGFASEENSSLQSNFDPSRPDRSLEAEYVAFAAVGGAPGINAGVGTLDGVPPVPGIVFPLTPNLMRIDLVGITLDIVGPGGIEGPSRLLAFGRSLPQGNPDSGADLPINPAGATLAASQPVPAGWLVTPHAGGGLTAEDVVQIISEGIAQADRTRAAIRLPLGSRTQMVFAVSDRAGNILGLYRMPDATIFSIDVAVAKARNVAYYADPSQLQPQDQLAGVPAGAAFTNRTFRYLALPHFPEGIDYAPPGPFSILNDGGVDPRTGLNVGPPLPLLAYQSAQGFDAFNPGTNFHDPYNRQNQNGVVFFPGSQPLYKDVNNSGQSILVGGLGVSGDGVDQDDVVTFAAGHSYSPPPGVPRADETFFNNIRLPYIKFLRNPEG